MLTKEHIYKTLEAYDEITNRAKEVFNLIDIKEDSREQISIVEFNYNDEDYEDEEVCIGTTFTCLNESCDDWYRFPIRYLWMDNTDILKDIAKKKEEEAETIRQEEEEIKREKEMEERAEYERLKKKYENYHKK